MSGIPLADELEKEITLMEQELIFIRGLLNECREKLSTEISEHAETKSAVHRYMNENKALQAQLDICLTGMQKLQDENTKRQENFVKLEVQFNAYLTERQQILDNCYKTEKENSTFKNLVEELKEQIRGHVMFIENYKQTNSKTESLVNEIIIKQELLNKEQIQMEKACKESLMFAEKLTLEAESQSKFIKEAKLNQWNLETEIIRLMAVISQLKAEAEENRKEKVQPQNENYLEFWTFRQRALEERNEELLQSNTRLQEELNFATNQIVTLMQNYK